MTREERIIHDMIDSLEDLGVDARERVGAYLREVDYVRSRLALVTSGSTPEQIAAFDAAISRGVLEAIVPILFQAHKEGANTAARLVGARRPSPVTPGPAFDTRVASALSVGIQDDVIRLGARIDSYLQRSLVQGIEPQQVIDTLLADFAERGPRVFGQELRSIEDTVSGSVGQAVQVGELEGGSDEMGSDNIGAMRMTWVCTLVGTCPDCLPRHNQTRTLDEWTAAGLPRTGWSVCQGRCKCTLHPAEVIGDAIQEPLRRARVKLEDGTSTGLTARVPKGLTAAEPADAEGRRRRAEELRRAFNASIEVRRAFRELGNSGAGQ